MQMAESIKFGVEIPKELNDSINTLVPWGLKSRLFRTMLRRLEYELRTGGNAALTEWLNWQPPTVHNMDTSGDSK
jgi:hypothetical protein